MSAISLSQALLVIFWFIFAILIMILALIARFYETNSGQTTYYRLYIIPILAMGIASVRYVSIDRWGGDWLGDLLMTASGLILSVLCIYLYRLMVSGRK